LDEAGEFAIRRSGDMTTGMTLEASLGIFSPFGEHDQ